MCHFVFNRMVVLGRLNEIAKQWIIDVSLSKVFEPLSFLISASYSGLISIWTNREDVYLESFAYSLLLIFMAVWKLNLLC